MHAFRQVDVFSAEPLRGNPVAVVHDADGLPDDQLAAFARWTNLSETTFLLTPTDPAADYRLRIFTPGGELPFAGHPTLGSAHAWLEAGGAPAADGVVVQECGAGLVQVRRDAAGVLSFEGPPLVRSGPVADADLTAAVAALGVAPGQVVDAAWIDNGPGWLGIVLPDAASVLALTPEWAAFGDLKIGVLGVHPGAVAGEPGVEVRAFCPQYGVPEDPVTGSLNAGFGQWLAGTRLPASYLAAQGTALQRAGRVRVTAQEGPEGRTVWVGGDTRTTIVGSVDLSVAGTTV